MVCFFLVDFDNLIPGIHPGQFVNSNLFDKF